MESQTLKEFYSKPFYSMIFIFFYMIIEAILSQPEYNFGTIKERKNLLQLYNEIPQKEYYQKVIFEFFQIISFDLKPISNIFYYALELINLKEMTEKIKEQCNKWANNKFKKSIHTRWYALKNPYFTANNQYDQQGQIDAIEVMRYIIQNQKKPGFIDQSLYEKISEAFLQKTNLNEDQQQQNEKPYTLEPEEKNQNEINSLYFQSSYVDLYQKQFETKQNQIVKVTSLEQSDEESQQIKLPVTMQVKTKREIQDKF